MYIITIWILLFVLFIPVYIYYNDIKSPDIWFIFFAILVLIYTLFALPCKNTLEKFDQQTTLSLSDILSKNNKIDTEEDISKITNNMMLYYTIFNIKSYPSFGKSWINIAPTSNIENIIENGSINDESKKTNCKTNESYTLSFDITPVFSRRSGFLLGTNRIIGPYSNSLGIFFNRSYTIALVVKHGNLLTQNGSSNNIEIIKLYANSPNNNALSLYIQNGSVEVIDTVQKGNLMFQYTDKTPVECIINNGDTAISFNKDLISFYFISKDLDYIRILYMNDRNQTVNEICRIPLTTEDITFSNKELIINRFANWNANIYTFGIYSSSFTDEDAIFFQSHYSAQLIKNIDPSFISIANSYNEALTTLETITRCPFDKLTCDTCSMVKSWTSTSEILKSSYECKKKIGEFCKNNQTHEFCTCWDVKGTMYNTSSCKLFRGLFGEDKACIDNLSEEDILYIKQKYKLLDIEECPKDIKNTRTYNNTYNEYDYEKLKISLDDNKTTLPVQTGNSDIPQVTRESTILSTTINEMDSPQRIEGPNQSFFNNFMKVIGIN